jgi:hypothetical protein
MITFINDQQLKEFEIVIKQGSNDHVLRHYDNRDHVFKNYNDDMKVHITKQYEYLLHLEKDSIHNFNIGICKYNFSIPQQLYKYILYDTITLYGMSVLNILRYVYHDNSFDLSKLLSSNGVKLAQKLNKLETTESKQAICLGYMTNNKFGVSVSPLFWLTMNRIVNTEKELLSSYVIIPISSLKNIKDINFSCLLHNIFSTYLHENIVNKNEKKLIFDKPTLIIDAVKTDAQSWHEDNESIMFYYHTLNKLQSKSRNDKIQSDKYHMRKLTNEQDIGFENLLNIAIDTFDIDDMNYVASSYSDYHYMKSDKVKFKQNKSQKSVSLAWSYRHASGSNTHRYWSTQKEYNTGKMGSLTKKIYEAQLDE